LSSAIENIRAKWWLILTYAVISVAVLAFIFFNLPPSYSTTTKIYVTPSSNSALANIYDAPYTDRAVKTVSLLAEGEGVVDTIAQTTSIDQNTIKNSFKVNYVIGTQIIEIKVRSGNGETVDAIAQNFPAAIEKLLQSIQVNTDEKNQIKISVAEKPSQSKQDYTTRIQIIAVLAVIVMLLGYALIHLISLGSKLVEREDDLEALDIKPLGRFLRSKYASRGVQAILKFDDEAIESVREIRTNLFLGQVGDRSHALCVLSANSGEGKSVFLASLACVLAEADKRVVVIDTDLRSPSLDRVFNLEYKKGLFDYLSGNAKKDEIIYKSGIKNLWIIPSGKNISNPSTILSKSQLEDLRDWLKQTCSVDYILLDTPPVSATADAATISKNSDGVIIVAQQSKTTHQDIKKIKETIEKTKTQVVGAVLSKSRRDDKRKNYPYK
jgi:capsular exopolysaccharide synthesis family protein